MRDAAARLADRLGPGFVPGLAFAAAAVAATQVVFAPYLFERVQAQGWAVVLPWWALHRVVPGLFVALVALLALHLSTRSASEMVARPWRFVGVLLGSGSLALALVWLLVFRLDPPPDAEALRIDRAQMYEAWFGLLDWGGLFGWFHFLALRRREDGLRLSALLGRHALLERRVAQSRLVVARAQIDPAMVARVLRVVQARADAALERDEDAGRDDGAAAMLIEQLASYLRLALGRVHDRAPSLASDLALVRSLAALREAETGIPIALQVTSREPGAARRPANAAFLVTRAMLDAALQQAPRRVALRLVTHTGGVAIDVVRDGVPTADAEHARVTAQLAALLPGLPTLRHTTDTGLQRHAAHVPLD